MQRIVLTFDDGFLCHYDTVAPLLEKYCLTATFFVCGFFVNHPYLSHLFMNWDQIRNLSHRGFEIGSHLFHHYGMTDKTVDHHRNIIQLEEKFLEIGLEKPISLCYPGFHVDADAVRTVRNAGYKFARAGCEKTSEFLNFQCGARGPHFNYLYDNPCNINCTGIFGRCFGVKNFKQSLIHVDKNEIPVFCFHSFNGRGIEEFLETDITAGELEECLEFIVKGSYQTIRMCDIEKF